jgi:hypothetical protein
MPMHEYVKIYEFAASLGSFEGYVYKKRSVQELDMDALENWSGNIEAAYRHLPDPVKSQFQDQCNQTAGRAIRSIEPVLGAEHPITKRLYAIITREAPLPESADAFNKKKWFAHES